MTLTRRLLFATAPAWLAAPSARAATAPADLAFTVWRQGRRIGTSHVAFTGPAEALTVTTATRFAITFGPLTVYSYRYDAVENWAAGALQNLAAATNNNGARASCTMRRQSGELLVAGSRSGQYAAPPGSIAGTHWNPAELAAPMIDPQDGALLSYTVADRGRDTPPWGGPPATHYALAGRTDLDLWYDDTQRWTGLRAIAKDRSVVEYRPA